MKAAISQPNMLWMTMSHWALQSHQSRFGQVMMRRIKTWRRRRSWKKKKKEEEDDEQMLVT